MMMTRERKRLIQREEKRLAELTTPGLHRINDGPGMRGLRLQITSSTARSYLLRYTLRGKTRDLGLGSAFHTPLILAVEKADAARVLLGKGIDPVEQRRAEETAARLNEAEVVTFRQCAESYIKAHRAGWKNEKHAAQWEA